MSRCAACGRAARDRRLNPTFRLAICPGCKHRTLLGDAPVRDESTEMDEGTYLQTYNGTFDDVLRRRLEMVQRCVPPGSRILDFGASYGHIARALRDAGHEMWAVEASGPARAALMRDGIYAFASLDDLPDRHFDAITAWHVIEHLPDPHAAARRMRVVLRPEGRLLAAVPNAGGLFARVSFEHWCWTMPWHRQYFTLSSMRRMLESAGFALDEISTDTGDVCALEMSVAGMLRVLPSRLSAPSETGATPPSSGLKDVGRVVVRRFSLPLQRLAAAAGRGEEIVLAASPKLPSASAAA